MTYLYCVAGGYLAGLVTPWVWAHRPWIKKEVQAIETDIQQRKS